MLHTKPLPAHDVVRSLPSLPELAPSRIPDHAVRTRRRVLGTAAIVCVLGLAYAGWTRPAEKPSAPVSGSFPVIAPEVLSLMRETPLGGSALLETDASGRISCAAVEVDLASVPKACLDVVAEIAPRGRVTGALKQLMNGTTYYEVAKDVDGLRVELLLTLDGRLAGREQEIAISSTPGPVLDAANAALAAGTVVAVERVEGPETLGGPEYHVKKLIGGEVTRIRVTERGAVEVLRKLRAELRVTR